MLSTRQALSNVKDEQTMGKEGGGGREEGRGGGEEEQWRLIFDLHEDDSVLLEVQYVVVCLEGVQLPLLTLNVHA